MISCPSKFTMLFSCAVLSPCASHRCRGDFNSSQPLPHMYTSSLASLWFIVPYARRSLILVLFLCKASQSNSFPAIKMHHNITSLLTPLTSILSLSRFFTPAASTDFHRRNLATIESIYAQNVYPTSLAFTRNQTVPHGLFDEKATGRITPLGNFTGFAESTEYFFALSPVPEAPLYQAFTKAQVVAYQSSCAEVATSIVWLTLGVYNPGATDHLKDIAVLKQVCQLVPSGMGDVLFRFLKPLSTLFLPWRTLPAAIASFLSSFGQDSTPVSNPETYPRHLLPLYLPNPYPPSLTAHPPF